MGIRSREDVKDALRRRLGIDVRALAALRVSLALLILVDLAMRGRDIVAFYTDAGVLPRETQTEIFAPAAFSLHTLSGSVGAQVFLFAVAAVFALALLVGYRTKTVLAVSLVLLLSLHGRNHFVLNAGDRLLRTTLFLCLFLPLGRRWSVDAYRNEGNEDHATVFSLATAVFLLHVVLVYTSNFLFKLHADGLWLTGDAVAHVMGMGRYTVLFGDYVADYTAVLVAANWLWLALLGCSVVLVLATGRLRTAAVSAYVTAHIGMFLTMSLGPFPLVSVAVLLPFLPSRVWDSLGRRLPTLPRSVEERLKDVVNEGSGGAFLPERPKRLVATVAVFFLIFTAFWQAVALGYAPAPDVVDSQAEVQPSEYFSWSMFIVDSPPDDRWFVASATLESGEVRNMPIFADVEGTDRPPDVSDTYPTTLWHRYMTNLRFEEETEKRAFAEYLCRRATGKYDEVDGVTVDYVEQTTRTDGYAEAERVEMLKQTC
jgi:hypothetical protein